MTFYLGYIDNTFAYPNAPIVIELGTIITKTPSGDKFLQRIPKTDYTITPINPKDATIRMINNYTVQVSKAASYTVLIYYMGDFAGTFSFFTYPAINQTTAGLLLQVINQELPVIYNPLQKFNQADNVGIAGVIAYVYQLAYLSYYNVISSLGTNSVDETGVAVSGYNPDLETIYIGVNQFLQNAFYPAQLLQTLMQVNFITGITIPELSIFISRIFFQFYNVPCAVTIYWDNTNKWYAIQLYYNLTTQQWRLGEINDNPPPDTFTTLGVNAPTAGGDATLGAYGYEGAFFWLIQTLVQRLFPVIVKYRFLTPLTISDFNAAYNVDEVDPERDFYTPLVNYYTDPDNIIAYRVTSNNNQFNTQVYYPI